MNLDYRFPLFDELLNGSLDPMKIGNELNSNYEIRLQEQIVADASDTGIFRLKFRTPLNVKCTYYRRLLMSETLLYCEDILSYLQVEEDSRIRAYLKDTLLDKHLVTCLKMLGSRIRQDHLQLSYLTHASAESNIEKVTNVYVFQLLKVCLAKAYLEFQHSLSDVIIIKQSEAMLYSAYFGDVPPVRTFLEKNEIPEAMIPPKDYLVDKLGNNTKEELKKQVAQPKEDYQNNTPPANIEFITVKEASKILRVDERTVRRRIEKGDITAVKKGGIQLIDKAEFEKYLKTVEIKKNPQKLLIND